MHTRHAMRSILAFLVTFALASHDAALAAGSGGMGGGGFGGDVGGAAPSPAELARTAYNEGLKFKRRALRMEDEAASAKTDADRADAQRQAAENWARAIAGYREAISLNPKSHQALNELGFALRKTGDAAQAIAAYDAALALKPNFAEAIEYRAEA